MIVSDPAYWLIMFSVVVSSNAMDFATTRFFLSKGGWREINPAMKEHVNTNRDFATQKILASVFLLGFLFLISFFTPVTADNIEHFSFVSSVAVVMSGIVAFLNPAIVLGYKIKDICFFKQG